MSLMRNSTEPTVIQTYIQRFRSSVPHDRSERAVNLPPFWWKKHDNLSGDMEKPTKDVMPDSVSKKIDLQFNSILNRATKALSMQTNDSDFERIVSSDSVSFTTVENETSVSDVADGNHLLQSALEGINAIGSKDVNKVANDQDNVDILYQWRLKRRMEEAHQHVSKGGTKMWPSEKENMLAGAHTPAVKYISLKPTDSCLAEKLPSVAAVSTQTNVELADRSVQANVLSCGIDVAAQCNLTVVSRDTNNDVLVGLLNNKAQLLLENDSELPDFDDPVLRQLLDQRQKCMQRLRILLTK